MDAFNLKLIPTTHCISTNFHTKWANENTYIHFWNIIHSLLHAAHQIFFRSHYGFENIFNLIFKLFFKCIPSIRKKSIRINETKHNKAKYKLKLLFTITSNITIFHIMLFKKYIYIVIFLICSLNIFNQKVAKIKDTKHDIIKNNSKYKYPVLNYYSNL